MVKLTPTLWRGPGIDGITFSLLSRWLCCRERFRLLVVEGLRPISTFSPRMEYGNMWHVCEESLARSSQHSNPPKARQLLWESDLKSYCRSLCGQYQAQQEQIQHWYNVCKVQFPVYVEYWSKHPDVKNRTPLLQEEVFDVPYTLPSRRVIRLRGKLDSVDLVGSKNTASVYIQENKSKSDINEQQLKRQLAFDLQSMMYIVALRLARETLLPSVLAKVPIAGVRYNVVRRPLSGGKGSIRPHKPTKNNPSGENLEAFYDRVQTLIVEEPEYYFMRWAVEITAEDVHKFEKQFLIPCLEELCDWWEWIVSHLKNPFDSGANTIHWRMPYGVYNILAEGGSTELDEYLATKSTLGLVRTNELFGELQ